MKKKGYIQDFLFFGIIILIIAVVFISVNLLLKEINTNIQGSDMSSNAKDMMSEQTGGFAVVYDNIFIMVFFMFILGIIVSYYVIQTNPALFFPIAFIFAFILVVFAITGNVFDKFNDDPTIASSADEFEGTSWIMGHIVEIMVILGFVGITALLAKNYLT